MVFAIERQGHLLDAAQQASSAAQDLFAAAPVHFSHGDGTQGLAARAPFARIHMGCVAEQWPDALLEQLADGGRAVFPCIIDGEQRLCIADRVGDEIQRQLDLPVDFAFITRNCRKGRRRMSLTLQCHSDARGTLSMEQSSDESGRIQVTLVAGADGFNGACSLVHDLPQASAVPWMLFPGFSMAKGVRICAVITRPWALRVRMSGPAPSWDFALDRGAFPVLLACLDDERWIGFDWDTHYAVKSETNDDRRLWGDSEPQIGLGFSWDFSENVGSLRLNLPANESPRRHARCPQDSATEKRLTLAPYDEISFSVAVHDFVADRHGYQQVLRPTYDRLRAQGHSPAMAESDAELSECAVHGLRAWHWIDDPGYMVYTAAYDRSAEYNANNKNVTLGWHFESLGFVGGFPVAYGMLWHDHTYEDMQTRHLAERMIDRFCREGQTEWGFFRTSYHPGKARTLNGDMANPAGVGVANADPSGDTPFYGSCWQGDQAIIHARTTADASYYLARSLPYMKGHSQYEGWRQSLRRSLDAALSVQDEAGRFGQLYNVVEKTVSQPEGSGGLLWVPALDAAIDLFADDSDYQATLLEAMKKAGAAYQPDVEAEYVVGAPEDVQLAPTSEDGYNAILSYAALYKRDPQDTWLALWQRAADWTLTFRKAYNVSFDKRNIMGAYDFRTVGGDFASAQQSPAFTA